MPGAIDAQAAVGVHRKVEFLSVVDDETLVELFEHARQETHATGSTIVSELEPGADVFIILTGEAEVSVDATLGERQIIGTLAAGSGFGEMSSLTGELRSATVTAKTSVVVLVISDRDFDALRERRPQVARALVRVLSRRIAETERAIDAIFSAGAVVTPPAVIDRGRGSIARVWRELVVARRRDIASLTLAAFVVTLLVVRASVFLSFRFDVAPRDVLRMAYMTGFGSLVASACASLLTFRPEWRRAIAVVYGAGLALILNELGVTLAFDIFFKDIHTPDPNTPFDIERLYERGAAVHGILIGLVVLIQAAYLRRFYARVGFVLMTRARKLLPGR